MVSDFAGAPPPEGLAECAVCHRRFPAEEMRPLASLGAATAFARAEVEALSPGGLVCREDRARFRRLHIERLLSEERGALGTLDREVIASLEEGSIVAADVEAVFEEGRSFGERAADTVAAFGGSWAFILSFGCAILVWMLLNVSGVAGAAVRSWDPYPFILLNLALSCVAALQAPIIMMSQRRQEAKDRLRAENDYKVNLKAELEIRHLHDKIDRQIIHQWERLAEIQRVQLALLEELAEDRGR